MKPGGWWRLIRRAAWSLALGIALTAGLLAFCILAAPRSGATTLSWVGAPSDNLCFTQRSWGLWAHSVTILVRRLTEPDAPLETVMPPVPPEAKQYSYGSDHEPEPRIPLGDGLSVPPTAREVTDAGRWSETAYGWPLRCLRIRGWDAGLQGGRPGPAWSPKMIAGRWPIALAPIQTAVTVATLSGLVFVLSTAIAAARRTARARRHHCTSCGYPLPPTGICPECGTAGKAPATSPG